MSNIKLKQDDFVFLISKKLNISEDTIDFIIKDFFQQVRIQFKEGDKDILLDRLLKFKYKTERAEKYLAYDKDTVDSIKNEKTKNVLRNKTSNLDNLSDLSKFE